MKKTVVIVALMVAASTLSGCSCDLAAANGVSVAECER